jgi:hypothetical protein
MILLCYELKCSDQGAPSTELPKNNDTQLPKNNEIQKPQSGLTKSNIEFVALVFFNFLGLYCIVKTLILPKSEYPDLPDYAFSMLKFFVITHILFMMLFTISWYFGYLFLFILGVFIASLINGIFASENFKRFVKMLMNHNGMKKILFVLNS